MSCGWCGRESGDECNGCRVVVEAGPSGTYCRASRLEPDGSIVLGPSAPTPEAAVRELDRDAGGKQIRVGPRRPGEPSFTATRPGVVRPGVLALIATLTGCASLSSFADKAEQVRSEAAALYAAADELDRECAELQDPRPQVCEAAARLMETLHPYMPEEPE